MAATDSSKPRLFLSYSRQDSTFADELIISIESYGFEVVFDRGDLFPGEPWEPRLRNLITTADTTVCIVSTNWIASDQCLKELQIALQQGRRVVPAIIDPVKPSEMPDEVSRLQFVFFHGEGQTYARGTVALIDALRTDIGWVREQSRLLDKADEWVSANKSKALLLRGTALERAQDWIMGPTPEHTRIAPRVVEYVEASRAGREDDEKSQLRDRLRFAALGFIGALTAFAAAAGVGMWGFALASKAEETKNAILEIGEDLGAYNVQDDDGSSAGSLSGSDRSLGDTETSPDPASSRDGSTTIEKWVELLNDGDPTVRIRAGQQIADRIRAADNETVRRTLITQLQGRRLDELSASGRFNVLYMLNVTNDWAGTPDSMKADLSTALQAILDRRTQGVAIGPQTQDCIDKLQRKLDGEKGVENRCGGR